jgi:hypothetical protein
MKQATLKPMDLQPSKLQRKSTSAPVAAVSSGQSLEEIDLELSTMSNMACTLEESLPEQPQNAKTDTIAAPFPSSKILLVPTSSSSLISGNGRFIRVLRNPCTQ